MLIELIKPACRVTAFPELGLAGETLLHYQCQGKKVRFYLVVLGIQVGVLGLVLLCSLTSIVWCIAFRSVSKASSVNKYLSFTNEVFCVC